jgi:undecaprenyl-diphosphatase
MNDYIAAAVIGIVEGLTEFLPVSSTAHIRITQELLGLPRDSEYWKMFAIVIQLGAILSVVVYFRARLLGFVLDFFARKSEPMELATGSPRHPAESARSDRTLVPTPPEASAYGSGKDSPLPHGISLAPISRWRHPLVLVLIAFVVTAIPCYLIDKKIGENLESLQVMGWALLVGGIAMWIIDAIYGDRGATDTIEKINLRQAIVIGGMQIFAAAFPGTSRSMSTIAGGQIMGLSRGTALEFSFFLSIPVMFAATGFKLLKFMLDEPIAMSGKDWGVLGIGFSVSFIVALAVIAWFMAWVRQRGFVPFAIYRILAGIAVLVATR